MNGFSGTQAQCSASMGLAQTAPKKISQVEQEVEIIKQDLSYLQDRISSLANKLNPVLRTEIEVEKNTGTPRETLIPLAETLRSFSDSIKYQANNIGNIIDRLEI